MGGKETKPDDQQLLDQDAKQINQPESTQNQQSQPQIPIQDVSDFKPKYDKNEYQNLKLSIENYQKILQPRSCKPSTILAENKNDYAYYNNTKSNSSSNLKSKRLAKEVLQLQKLLPIYVSNAIFVAYDKERIDTMKAIIIGSEDSPYSNGVFLYDIFFDDTYPMQPPKISLMTTGKSTIRFNPNLYDNGYICLSVLGTWRGNTTEQWSPGTNLNLVLMSIQSIVMNDDVYFNEPGYEDQKGTTKGAMLNNGYSNIVRCGSIQYAMIEMMKNPPPQFADIIYMHFYLKKEKIIEQVQNWINKADELEKQSSYLGLVEAHNKTQAYYLRQPGNYKSALQQLFTQLKEELDKIKPEQIEQIKQKWLEEL